MIFKKWQNELSSENPNISAITFSGTESLKYSDIALSI